jgi:hypothetical protein
MGIERLKERSDSLKAEITVQSTSAGRVLGPNTVDLLSARSQAEFANACHKRVNGLGEDTWRAIVVFACASVARDFRKPTPTIRLSEVPARGPVQYVVPLHVPERETTLMYGDGESGKSIFAVRIAASIATGQDVPWGCEVKTGNVLYLDWETNEDTVASRLRRVCAGMCIDVPDNIFYQQCFRSLSDELPGIREQISKKHIALVVVDSIGFASDGPLTEDQTARSTINALRQMSPATRLVVAHVSAETARMQSGSAAPFGSRFFWNGMRSGIEVRRSEDVVVDGRIDVGLYHRKNNDGPKARPLGISVAFEGEIGPIVFDQTELSDVPDLAARTSLSQRVLEALKRGSATVRDLAEDLDANEGSVKTTLNRLGGKVVQLHPGAGGRGKVAEWGRASLD